MLSSGALAIRFTFLPLFGQYVLRYGATERGQTTEGVPSTLLGPEEAAASKGCRLERPVLADLLMEVREAWFRPYLENYTVDASIFWTRSLSYDGI
jgi:hypothetical protein